MNPYAHPHAGSKWYHVVCTLHRRRERLKIPAAARFCERSIRDSCSLPGWAVHGVSVTPAEIRLLLKIPPQISRRDVIRAVKRSAGGAVRRAGVVPQWTPRVWGDRSWCSVVRHPRAVIRLRETMTLASRQPGPLLPVPVDQFVWENPSL